MREVSSLKLVLRWMTTLAVVAWSLFGWYHLFSQSGSYPIGPQDYGTPLTFRRDYYDDVVLYFPQALLFDVAVAALVVLAVAYSLWTWSANWSIEFYCKFLLVLSVCTVILIFGVRIHLILLLPSALLLLVGGLGIWLTSVAYASAKTGGYLFGPKGTLLLPLALTVGMLVLGWQCWPQDIFERGSKDPGRVVALVARLQDDNPRVRSLALRALQDHGPFEAPAAAAIIQAMSDPDDRVQEDAISLARQLGPAAIEAVPIILDKFNQGGRSAFLFASRLAELGPTAKAAVPDLKEKLPASTDYSKLKICAALWKIEGNTTLVVPALIELLDDEFGPIRRDAATLLGQIGPEAADAVPALKAMVDHVPEADTPEPEEEKEEASSLPRPGKMSDAEFYPQIRSAAQLALTRILRSE
ncbi:HEAT repeat domain-containing protein [Schlesneria sp. DSM 10557]|uniref:HEAT repeat domain-containing protein n=1 Tax=Schlesneria sp. DSM 10557 TaxID=3044399 RepID=UPI0035A0E784